MVQKSIGHLKLAFRRFGPEEAEGRSRPRWGHPEDEVQFQGMSVDLSVYFMNGVSGPKVLSAFGVQAANGYPESGQAGPRTELAHRRSPTTI